MEPLGTITKYYKFVNDEVRSKLGSVMKESSNYNDFVHRLSGYILQNEASTDLVYITTVQVWCTKEKELMNAISEKFGHLDVIRPWIQSFKPFQINSEDYKSKHDILEDLVDSPISNWMIVELLLLHSFILLKPLESTRRLSIAKDVMSRYPDLKCFEPLIELVEGYLFWLEGKKPVGLSHLEKGLQLARENDDAVYEYYGLLSSANCKKQLNYREGLDLFEHAYQIAQELEIPYFVAEILNDSTMAYEIAGEYDLAISCQLEGINAYYGGVSIEICYGILSRLYAALGDGQKALEWANRAVEISPIQSLLLRKARALIVLAHLDEADEVLEIAHQKVLEVGYDIWLGRYYFVLGLLEIARGELVAARGTLEQSYEILTPVSGTVFINETLIALARLEVLITQSKNAEFVGSRRWLSALEDHARTNDLPGISMQAAMLKSEHYQNQGELRDAHEILQRALELSDSPGVRTLRRRISTRIQELEEILRDQELVS